MSDREPQNLWEQLNDHHMEGGSRGERPARGAQTGEGEKKKNRGLETWGRNPKGGEERLGGN